MVIMEFAVQFFAEREQLFPLEVGNHDTLPAVAGSLKCCIHQFLDGPLAKRLWDGVTAAALFQKQSFQ